MMSQALAWVLPLIASAVLLVVASGCAVAEKGLVGRWDFDEGKGDAVRDSSKNESDGKLVNSPKWVKGVRGYALSFSGKEDRVEIAHSDGMNLGAEGQSYSVSFWFRSSVLPKDIPDAHFITKVGSPYPFSFVQIASGVVQVRTYDGKVCPTIDTGLGISDGEWHFVVGMRDGRKRRLSLFVDGLLLSTGEDTSSGDLRNDGPLWIGRSHGDDFSGALDEVRLYNRLLTRQEIRSLYAKPGDGIKARRMTRSKLAVKRAEGVPATRRRLEAWKPVLATDGKLGITKERGKVRLKNSRMEVVISRKTGEVVSLVSGGRELLSAPGGVNVRDLVAGVEFGPDEGKVTEVDVEDDSPRSVAVAIRKKFGKDHSGTITYTLGAGELCCDARLTTSLAEPRESRIEFIMPVLSGMTKAFWASADAPFDLSDPPAEQVIYRQFNSNAVVTLPALTVFDPGKDVGLGFVAPFDLPKPALCFRLNSEKGRLEVSNFRLRLAKGEPARAAVYVVPHEGCWRPSLAWMLKTYPDYFRPGTKGGIEAPGWYWLGGPHEGPEQLEKLRVAGCKWFQIHGHFPFYGLYMPEAESWEAVVGLADQGKANLDDWEKGKPQGGFKNGYAQMRKAVELRQRYDLQPFLYFQSFESWNQYAEKYFPDDITKNRSGGPLGAWYNCKLMNPDPAFAWGRHIAAQIRRVPEQYPALDGIFYDRDDYKDYDYAHDDGVTMDIDAPCYMLAFAQQQMNEVVTGVLRQHKMGIWTNGPTSIEVCKDIDGVMCETNGWAAGHQYLGLARPMVLLPYFFDTNSYDNTPEHTEEKLKVALSMGFFPSLTYGGEECKELDGKYRPLFELMKDREWVLHAKALKLPEGMKGNIFRSPKGYYMVTVVDFNKSQVAGDEPTRDVCVEISVPDEAKIKHCCVLSGDSEGRKPIPFSREGSKILAKIPRHLASSMLVFSSKPLSEIAEAAPLLSRKP